MAPESVDRCSQFDLLSVIFKSVRQPSAVAWHEGVIMVTFFQSRWISIGIAIGASVLVAASLTATPRAEASPMAGTANVADGSLANSESEIVDALLFGTGPRAGEFGTNIESVLSPAEVERVREYTSEARQGLLRSQAAQVRKAVAGITSGDVNRVEGGLANLRAAFETYIGNAYSEEELRSAADDRASESVVPMCGAVAVCAAAIAVAVYAAAAVHNAVAITAAAAVVVSVALWCGAWVGCGKGAQSGADSRVVHEKYLAHVTRTAAKAAGEE